MLTDHQTTKLRCAALDCSRWYTVQARHLDNLLAAWRSRFLVRSYAGITGGDDVGIRGGLVRRGGHAPGSTRPRTPDAATPLPDWIRGLRSVCVRSAW